MSSPGPGATNLAKHGVPTKEAARNLKGDPKPPDRVSGIGLANHRAASLFFGGFFAVFCFFREPIKVGN